MTRIVTVAEAFTSGRNESQATTVSYNQEISHQILPYMYLMHNLLISIPRTFSLLLVFSNFVFRVGSDSIKLQVFGYSDFSCCWMNCKQTWGWVNTCGFIGDNSLKEIPVLKFTEIIFVMHHSEKSSLSNAEKSSFSEALIIAILLFKDTCHSVIVCCYKVRHRSSHGSIFRYRGSPVPN